MTVYVGKTFIPTVTVVVVLVFPLLSMTVSVTLFVPTSAHVNVFGEAESEAMPQASVLPLLMLLPSGCHTLAAQLDGMRLAICRRQNVVLDGYGW
ncbi:MAG: hypothetical protein R2788_25100 [Saprospiraceae bacterium]